MRASNTIVKVDIDRGTTHIHDSYDKSETLDKNDVEKVQKYVEELDKVSIELVPIVENKHNNVFLINNRLKKI